MRLVIIEMRRVLVALWVTGCTAAPPSLPPSVPRPSIAPAFTAEELAIVDRRPLYFENHRLRRRATERADLPTSRLSIATSHEHCSWDADAPMIRCREHPATPGDPWIELPAPEGTHSRWLVGSRARVRETMEWRKFILSPPTAVQEIVLEHFLL